MVLSSISSLSVCIVLSQFGIVVDSGSIEYSTHLHMYRKSIVLSFTMVGVGFLIIQEVNQYAL